MLNHEYFMKMALSQAEDALRGGEFPVGAVFVHGGEVIASGRRAHSQASQGVVNELDHAEILALKKCLSGSLQILMSEVVVYSTMEPCLMCYSTMILNGIRNIVFAYEDVMGGGTNLPLEQLNPLYKDMKINLVSHVLRAESLKLFQCFFADQNNNYWKDSLLASYTMKQQV